ncbi:hypothetical protein LEMLEM_LOCUS18596, partial [Lemmus lemmus]
GEPVEKDLEIWKRIYIYIYIYSGLHQGQNKRHSLAVIMNPVTERSKNDKPDFLYIGLCIDAYIYQQKQEYKSEFMKHLCKTNIL